MQTSNIYIAEKVARERVRDHMRQAERDRQVLLASQASTTAARGGDRLGQANWLARLVAAIVSILP